jgi:hypothetical protein
VGLADLAAQVAIQNCPAAQDATSYSDPFDLGPGYYRPVFVGSAALGHLNGGVSEVAIQLQTPTGLPVTDYSKSVSASGVSERSFQYVYMSAAGQLVAFSRASTNCGNASISGVLAFERVSD